MVEAPPLSRGYRAFFARSYGMAPAEIGWMALSLGLCGMIGALLGGEPASRFAPADEQLQLRGCAIAITLGGLLSAAVYLCANLIGMGFGPVSAGILSDLLRPIWGEESVHDALLYLSPGYIWAASYLWIASGSVAADITTADKPPASLAPAA